MTPAELLERLAPARLPDGFRAIGAADLATAFGLGLLAAVIVAPLLRPLLRRRVSPLARAQAELRALAGLPRAEALLRRAELLARLGGALEPDERAALYARDGQFDERALDRRILQAARGR